PAGPSSSDARVAAARQFALDAARLCAATRCHNVVLLDVSGLSPVTDYFILASGTSPRQMRSVCDGLEEMGLERGHKPLTRSGTEGESWMLIDFVDVVVHVFSQQSRSYYDLDGLWGDAKPVAWEDEKVASPTP
ncbi:MAG TPA: ribosome silencing factor, partial [Tepidisphaeraceae bacterium]|nr:ribosome silencing factor [Tepidisphaeraceae bacterium]